MNENIFLLADTLKNITSQMKSLLKEYQTKVTMLDSTIDVLNDEIENVKADVLTEFEERTTHASKQMVNNGGYRYTTIIDISSTTSDE